MAKKPKNKKKTILIVVFLVLFLLLGSAGAVVGLVYTDKLNIPALAKLLGKKPKAPVGARSRSCARRSCDPRSRAVPRR